MKEIVCCLFWFSEVPEEHELDVSFNESEFEVLEMVDLPIVKSDNSKEVDVDVSTVLLYAWDYKV